jgi:molecular chaperone GrpE
MKHKDKEKHNTDDPHEAPSRDSKYNKDSIESLRAEIEELQKEKDELFGKLQRISADYANFQKRSAKQITDSVSYEKEMIIKTLLPALDNFEHTLQNVEGAENIDALIKGVRIIYDQMLDILKSHGVEQTKSLGEQFDPNLHEAMMRKTDEQQEDNIVLEEFQKGYKLNGRTIRPSKVIVNKLPIEQGQEPDEFPEESEGDYEGDENQFTDTE